LVSSSWVLTFGAWTRVNVAATNSWDPTLMVG
jgi:hypothetical protein